MGESLATELRRVLRPLAAGRHTVTYRELVALANVPPPHRIHTVTLALEDLMREDQAAGRPLLAALAVSRHSGGIPGRGFFQFCAALGLYDGPDQGPEAAAFHAAELERAFAYWGSGPGNEP